MSPKSFIHGVSSLAHVLQAALATVQLKLPWMLNSSPVAWHFNLVHLIIYGHIIHGALHGPEPFGILSVLRSVRTRACLRLVGRRWTILKFRRIRCAGEDFLLLLFCSICLIRGFCGLNVSINGTFVWFCFSFLVDLTSVYLSRAAALEMARSIRLHG